MDGKEYFVSGTLGHGLTKEAGYTRAVRSMHAGQVAMSASSLARTSLLPAANAIKRVAMASEPLLSMDGP